MVVRITPKKSQSVFVQAIRTNKLEIVSEEPLGSDFFEELEDEVWDIHALRRINEHSESVSQRLQSRLEHHRLDAPSLGAAA